MSTFLLNDGFDGAAGSLVGRVTDGLTWAPGRWFDGTSWTTTGADAPQLSGAGEVVHGTGGTVSAASVPLAGLATNEVVRMTVDIGGYIPDSGIVVSGSIGSVSTPAGNRLKLSITSSFSGYTVVASTNTDSITMTTTGAYPFRYTIEVDRVAHTLTPILGTVRGTSISTSFAFPSDAEFVLQMAKSFNDSLSVAGVIVEGLTQAEETIPTPTPGLTWTGVTVPLQAWRSVAFGNGTFVALGATGDIMTSTDRGRTWVTQTYFDPDNFTYQVVFGNGVFVVFGETGIGTSSDNGVTWTRTATTPCRGGAFNGSTFIGLTGSTGPSICLRSASGAGWGSSLMPSNGAWESAVGGNGVFLSWSVSGTPRLIAVSLDGGASWSYGPSFPWGTQAPTGFAVHPNYLLVCYTTTGSPQYLAATVSGATWDVVSQSGTAFATNSSGTNSVMAVGDGLVVILDGAFLGAPSDGEVTTQTRDLNTYATGALPAAQRWSAAAWGAGTFVAVGLSDTAAYADYSFTPPVVSSAFWADFKNTFEVI